MRNYVDTYRHKGLRKKLINLLREKGITNETILEAMMQLPRHYFLDEALEDIAYQDRAFPIGADQTISQPYTVAYQTQLLDVKARDKILEIGTGSAYQAMVLAELGARVFTIERQKKLYTEGKKFDLRKKYPTIKYFYGDGFKGLPNYAPFDKIIITAAAPEIPEQLLAQLKTGGMMVVPVNEGDAQRMTRLTKKKDGKFISEKFDTFSFVPMLEGKSK